MHPFRVKPLLSPSHIKGCIHYCGPSAVKMSQSPQKLSSLPFRPDLLISGCQPPDSSTGSRLTAHQFHAAVIWGFNDEMTGNEGRLALRSYAWSLTTASVRSKDEWVLSPSRHLTACQGCSPCTGRAPQLAVKIGLTLNNGGRHGKVFSSAGAFILLICPHWRLRPARTKTLFLFYFLSFCVLSGLRFSTVTLSAKLSMNHTGSRHSSHLGNTQYNHSWG